MFAANHSESRPCGLKSAKGFKTGLRTPALRLRSGQALKTETTLFLFAAGAAAMWPMHAHKRGEHAEQGSQPGGMRLPALQRNRGSRPRSPHLPTSGKDGPPRELEELPGLEKDQNRRARLAMRCGLLLCSLPAQLRRSRTKPDQKTGCTRPSTKSNGSCVECENTPTMLWMSSSKRNI